MRVLIPLESKSIKSEEYLGKRPESSNAETRSQIPLPARLAAYVSRADKERVHRGTLKDGAGLARSAPELAAGTKGLFDTEPV